MGQGDPGLLDRDLGVQVLDEGPKLAAEPSRRTDNRKERCKGNGNTTGRQRRPPRSPPEVSNNDHEEGSHRCYYQPMTHGIAITIIGVSKSYAAGQVRALDGIDLEIAAGEWIAVTGPTGSGKSTLLALLAMLEQADAGNIRLDDRPTKDLQPAEKWRAQNLGIVFQHHSARSVHVATDAVANTVHQLRLTEPALNKRAFC